MLRRRLKFRCFSFLQKTKVPLDKSCNLKKAYLHFDQRRYAILHFQNLFTLTEKELIQGCLREDRQCQRELFQRYAGKMLAVCRRYARHELEAEDLLQEAFIKVFNNIEKFGHHGSFEGWIRRIVINTAIKNYNKSSFQRERIGIEDYHDLPIDPEAIVNLSRDELLAEIARLPTGYRIVFNLYAIEGYSHAEIAQTLDIGESTSRSQLVKARKMLRERIVRFKKIAI